MNVEGLRAYEAAHGEHMKRRTYEELFFMVSKKAVQHEAQCRLDALHFLTLNLEFMVAEPLGYQRSGTLAAIANPELRRGLEKDLDLVFEEIGRKSVGSPAQFDPSQHGIGGDGDDPQLRGMSAGSMLELVGNVYRRLYVAEWQLWG